MHLDIVTPSSLSLTVVDSNKLDVMIHLFISYVSKFYMLYVYSRYRSGNFRRKNTFVVFGLFLNARR